MIFDKFIGITALCDFLKPRPLEKKKQNMQKEIRSHFALFCATEMATFGYYFGLLRISIMGVLEEGEL